MYRYWFALHILGILAFLACHGVSMFVLYRIRRVGLDRDKIAELIAFNGTTVRPTYISLAVLVVAGFVAGFEGQWLNDWWIWIAIAVLVLTTVLMTAIAKPYFEKISASCGLRPSGIPRMSDEELSELVHAGTAHLITVVGMVGLLVIVYLMIFKPGIRY